MNKLQQQQQNFEGASLKSCQINNHYKEIYNGIPAIKKKKFWMNKQNPLTTTIPTKALTAKLIHVKF